MSRIFTISDRDYWNEGEIIFKKKRVEFKPGLTVLVGCNGTGKTTLLYEVKRQLNKKKIPVMYFDNLRDGGENARTAAGYIQDFTFLGTSLCSSEGENIMMNVGLLAQKIGNTLRKKYVDEKEFWILLDAVDSGLSVDNIIELKDFFNLVKEDNKNKDIYIIAAANEYELAREEQCFDVFECKYTTFKDYEDYRNFIIKTRKRKDERYKDDEDEEE